jgi:murein DD-endopeptidase MepM/ murein hydrolase activator NlpD
MAISPAIALGKISKSTFSLRSEIFQTGKTTKTIQNTLSSGLSKKRNIWASTKILKQRRVDFDRAQIQKDTISAPFIINKKGGSRILSQSDRSLNIGDRLLSFIRYFSVGWLLGNLPTWINYGEQFTGRIKIASSILSNYGDEMIKVLNDIAKVASASLKNISTLDFSDKSGLVGNAISDLTSSIDDLGDGIEESFKVLFAPFKELPSENKPEQSPSAPSTTEPELPAPNNPNQTRASYGTKEQRAMLDAIAWAEGGRTYRTMFGGGQFNISNGWKHPDTVVRAGGLASAAAGRYQFMPFTWNRVAKALGLKDFSPINQDKAAIYLMDERLGGNSAEILRREGVSNRVLNAFAGEWAAVPMANGQSFYGQSAKKIQDFKNKYNTLMREAPPPTARGLPTPPPSPSSTRPSTNFAAVSGTSGRGMGNRKVSVPYSAFKPGSGAVITSVMGMRYERQHTGYDLAANPGTPLYAYFSGKVINVGLEGSYNDGGYGNWIIWKDDVYGAYHFYGHMLKRPELRIGQTFSQGALLGYVGDTGLSYGPHLHWEISSNAPNSMGNFTTGRQDPGVWVKNHPIKAGQPKPIQISSNALPVTSLVPASTQIKEEPKNNVEMQSNSYLNSLTRNITQERMGQQILIIDERMREMSQGTAAYSDKNMMSIKVNEFSLLNNFMRNKLLLDLNYV